MVKPGVLFDKIRFICPVCETELTTDKCSKCGQLIDCDDFEIDVCPAEVLADHRDVEEVKEAKEEEDVSNETIGISDCRSLREIVHSMTSSCMLTKAEFIQIMMVLASAVERLESEGQVSKE